MHQGAACGQLKVCGAVFDLDDFTDKYTMPRHESSVAVGQYFVNGTARWVVLLVSPRRKR